MIRHSASVRKTAVLLFVALTACYLVLIPGTTIGRGYISEEMEAGNQVLKVLGSWLSFHPAPRMLWSRQGILPVLFDLPFLLLGNVLVSQDFILSLQPLLLTAGILVLVFLWLRKMTSAWMSLILTLTGAFATMLWPYVYIGMETKQSFFVLLVGYLALANGKIRSWPGLILLGITAGLSLTVKITGIVMWPAIAYLVYVQFRNDWRVRRIELLVVTLLIAGVWKVGNASQGMYWSPKGGAVQYLHEWITDSPIRVFTNLIGVFGSPTKGLAVFAPVLLLCIYAIPRAWRSEHRDTAVFAFLITACSAGLISLLTVTSDEVWGPRYMHVAVAPLLLCIGAAWPRLDWKIALSTAGLAIAGLLISFLGTFSIYGVPSVIMREAGHNTMEWINGDPVWLAPMLEARLVRAWFTPGDAPMPWTASHTWVWEPPKDHPIEWKAVDLMDYCTPQSVLLKSWRDPLSGTDRITFRVSQFSAIAGPLLLLWLIFRTFRE